VNSTISYYNENARELSKRYESADIENIHGLLLDTFPEKSFLLELGCGSGRDAVFMYSNKYDLLAIDGSSKMISEAKRIHPELNNILHTVIIPEELEFENASFDGIYSIATLMHLTTDRIDQTIEKISNMLKPNAKFLFSVSTSRDDLDIESKDINGREFTTLSKQEWINYCEKHSMKLVCSILNDDGLGRRGITWLTCIFEKGV